MRVNRISFSSLPKRAIPNPEVKQFVQGDYLLITENYPHKQIRIIKNIRSNKIISREVLFDNLYFHVL